MIRRSTLDGLAAARPARSPTPGSRGAAWPARPASVRRSRRGTACRRRPARTCPSCCRTAPVNDPFSWPNSADSTSSAGMAARFTGMNGPSARPDSRWIIRASSSLPVPLSPRISTVASSPATLRTRSSDLAHRAARAGHERPLALVGHLGAQRHHLPVQVRALGGVAHERQHGVVLEVLGDVVVGAELHRPDGGLDLVDGRDHDDLDQALRLLDLPQHLEAADARHPDVEQHHVHVLAVEDGQPALARRRAQHAVLAAQDRRQRVAHPLVVVDDEDCLGAWSQQGRPFQRPGAARGAAGTAFARIAVKPG